MLFRLKRNPKCKRSEVFDSLYGWIEVLAIQPDKLVQYEEPHLAHVRRIDCEYVCKTDEGLRCIDARALWRSIENDEYLLSEPGTSPRKRPPRPHR